MNRFDCKFSLLCLFPDSDDENHSFSLPKTVTWAPENEEHIIENREDLQALKTTTQRNRARQGNKYFDIYKIHHSTLTDIFN